MPRPASRVRAGAVVVVLVVALAVAAILDLSAEDSLLRGFFDALSRPSGRRGLIRDVIRRWRW